MMSPSPQVMHQKAPCTTTPRAGPPDDGAGAAGAVPGRLNGAAHRHGATSANPTTRDRKPARPRTPLRLEALPAESPRRGRGTPMRWGPSVPARLRAPLAPPLPLRAHQADCPTTCPRRSPQPSVSPTNGRAPRLSPGPCPPPSAGRHCFRSKTHCEATATPRRAEVVLMMVVTTLPISRDSQRTTALERRRPPPPALEAKASAEIHETLDKAVLNWAESNRVIGDGCESA